MERRADAMATVHEGPSPGTYARALERLYQINQMPAVMPGKRTHPNLYDRLLAAGVTPAYPRPAAPARLTWQLCVVMLLLVASTAGVTVAVEMRHQKRHVARAHGGI